MRSRPKALVYTATKERGPPNHLKTCAQKAHKLRRRDYTGAATDTGGWSEM